MSRVSFPSHCVAPHCHLPKWTAQRSLSILLADVKVFRVRRKSSHTRTVVSGIVKQAWISLSSPMIFSLGFFRRSLNKTILIDKIITSSWWDGSGSGRKCNCKMGRLIFGGTCFPFRAVISMMRIPLLSGTLDLHNLSTFPSTQSALESYHLERI